MKTLDYSEFPVNLGRLITENGCSVKDIADKLLVSPQAVYKWMNGESIPQLDKIVNLSDILNVSILDIIPVTELDKWDRSL
ncbi:Helix-turn-helix [Lachnospiraceae bacterium NE2001]|nr:Helix-turn-helix [Lachnospiraceae bacterium NE2001]